MALGKGRDRKAKNLSQGICAKRCLWDGQHAFPSGRCWREGCQSTPPGQHTVTWGQGDSRQSSAVPWPCSPWRVLFWALNWDPAFCRERAEARFHPTLFAKTPLQHGAGYNPQLYRSRHCRPPTVATSATGSLKNCYGKYLSHYLTTN